MDNIIFNSYKGSKITQFNGICRVESQISIITSGCSFKVNLPCAFNITIDNHQNDIQLHIKIHNETFNYALVNGENTININAYESGDHTCFITFMKPGLKQIFDILNFKFCNPQINISSSNKENLTDVKFSSSPVSEKEKNITPKPGSGTIKSHTKNIQFKIINGKRIPIMTPVKPKNNNIPNEFIVPLFDRIYVLSSTDSIDKIYEKRIKKQLTQINNNFNLIQSDSSNMQNKLIAGIKQAIKDNTTKALFLDSSIVLCQNFNWENLKNIRFEDWDLMLLETLEDCSSKIENSFNNLIINKVTNIKSSYAFIIKRQMFQLSLDLLNGNNFNEYLALMQQKKQVYAVNSQNMISQHRIYSAKNNLVFYPKTNIFIYINDKVNDEMLKQLNLTIKSLIDQTNKDFMVTFINDAGCDISSFVNILESSDLFVSVIQQEIALGFSVSMNKAINLSRNDFITWIYPGDILYPTFVEAHQTTLKNNPVNSEFITSKVLLNNNVIDSAYIYQTIKNYANYKGIQSFMMTRELFNKANGFNESLTIGQDYDLFVRLYNLTASYSLDYVFIKSSELAKNSEYYDFSGQPNISEQPNNQEMTDSILSMLRFKNKTRSDNDQLNEQLNNQLNNDYLPITAQNKNEINQKINECLDITKDTIIFLFNNSSAITRRLICILQALQKSFNIFFVTIWADDSQLIEPTRRVDSIPGVVQPRGIEPLPNNIIKMNYQTFNDYARYFMINTQYIFFNHPELLPHVSNIKEKFNIKLIFYDITSDSFENVNTINPVNTLNDVLEKVDIITYSSKAQSSLLTDYSSKLIYFPNVWEPIINNNSDGIEANVPFKKSENVIYIGYPGLVTSWIDFNLIKKVADNSNVHLIIAGTYPNKTEYSQTFEHQNITWLSLADKDGFNNIIPEVINLLDICIFPFKTATKNKMPGLFIPDTLLTCARYNKPILSTIDYSSEYPEILNQAGLFIKTNNKTINQDIKKILNQLNCEIDINYSIPDNLGIDLLNETVNNVIQKTTITDLQNNINSKKINISVYMDLCYVVNNEIIFINNETQKQISQLLNALKPYYQITIYQEIPGMNKNLIWNGFKFLIYDKLNVLLDYAIFVNESTFSQLTLLDKIYNFITVNFYSPNALLCLFMNSNFEKLDRCYYFNNALFTRVIHNPEIETVKSLTFMGKCSFGYGLEFIPDIRRVFPDIPIYWYGSSDNEADYTTAKTLNIQFIDHMPDDSVNILMNQTPMFSNYYLPDKITNNLITTYQKNNNWINYNLTELIKAIMPGYSNLSLFEKIGWITENNKDYETTTIINKSQMINSDHYWKNYIAYQELNVHDVDSIKKIISMDSELEELTIFNSSIPIAFVMNPEFYYANFELIKTLVKWHYIDIFIYSPSENVNLRYLHFIRCQTLDKLKQCLYSENGYPSRYKLIVTCDDILNTIDLIDSPISLSILCRTPNPQIADIATKYRIPILVQFNCDVIKLRQFISPDNLDIPIINISNYAVADKSQEISRGDCRDSDNRGSRGPDSEQLIKIGAFMENAEIIMKTIKRLNKPYYLVLYYREKNNKQQYDLMNFANTLNINVEFMEINHNWNYVNLFIIQINNNLPYEALQIMASGISCLIGYCAQSKEINYLLPNSLCMLYRNNDTESLKNQINIMLQKSDIHTEFILSIDQFNHNFANFVYEYVNFKNQNANS